MTEPKAKKNLHSKLAEVMAEVGRVPKNGENKQQGYKYVTESDLADAVRKHLSDRGVMLFMHVESCELIPVQSKQGGSGYVADVSTRHEFVDSESDDTYSFTMHGTGIDYPGDKAVYKALTGAVKYALMKTFLIATGDDPEATEEPKRKTSEKQKTESAPRGTASEAQIKKLGILASNRGLTKRDARLIAATEELGVVIESFNALSKEQASRLIEIWSSAGKDLGESRASAPLSPPSDADAAEGGKAPPPRADENDPASEEQWKRASRMYGSRGAVVSAAHKMFQTAKAEDVTKGQIAELIAAKVAEG